MKSLLLDQVAWDLVLDASRNIALADDPYASAQDVACAIKLFLGELWYNTTKGVPYYQSILGQWPSAAYLKATFEQIALGTARIAEARCTIFSLSDRNLTGRVDVINTAGEASGFTFGTVDQDVEQVTPDQAPIRVIFDGGQLDFSVAKNSVFTGPL